MAAKTGHNMKLYINEGSVASPTWTEIAQVGDVSIPDLSRGVAELKRRGNDFTKNLASIIQSISVEFKMFHGLEATMFGTLQAAFFAATPYEYAVMDGDITVTGNQGLRLPALIEQFPWDQPLEDVSSHDVRLAVAYMEDSGTEIDPSWLDVGS